MINEKLCLFWTLGYSLFLSEASHDVFYQDGKVILSKNNSVGTALEWGKEFNIEFDILVNSEISEEWGNVLHMRRETKGFGPPVVLWKLNGNQKETF